MNSSRLLCWLLPFAAPLAAGCSIPLGSPPPGTIPIGILMTPPYHPEAARLLAQQAADDDSDHATAPAEEVDPVPPEPVVSADTAPRVRHVEITACRPTPRGGEPVETPVKSMNAAAAAGADVRQAVSIRSPRRTAVVQTAATEGARSQKLMPLDLPTVLRLNRGECSRLEAGLAYFELAGAQAARDVARRNLSDTDELLILTDSLAVGRTGPVNDVEQARAEVDRCRQELATAEAAFQSASTRLARMLRLDAADGASSSILAATDDGSLPVEPVSERSDPARLIAQAQSSRPEIADAAAQDVDCANNSLAHAAEKYERALTALSAGNGRPQEARQALRAVALSRLDYVGAVTKHNRAQLKLLAATGGPAPR